jgi:hypothetical protein
MISRLSSKTEIPVPSNSTLVGSFCDLNLKNTEEDIVAEEGDFLSWGYGQQNANCKNKIRDVKDVRLVKSKTEGAIYL